MTDKEPIERTKINQKQPDSIQPPLNSADIHQKKDHLKNEEESQKIKNKSFSSENSSIITLNQSKSPFLFQNLKNFESTMANQLNQYYPHYNPLFEILNHIKFLNNGEDREIALKKKLNFSNIFIRCFEGHELLPFLYTFSQIENLPFYYLGLSEKTGMDFFSNYEKNAEEVIKFFRNLINQSFLFVIPLEAFAFEWNHTNESKNRSSSIINEKRIFSTCLTLINNIRTLCPLSTIVIIDISKNIIPIEFFSNFGSSLNIILPDAESRRRFLESLFSDSPEGAIEGEHLSLQMRNWNYAHIRNHIRYANHLFQAQQFTQKKNKQQFDDNYILEMLENNRFYNPQAFLSEKTTLNDESGRSNAHDKYRTTENAQILQTISNQTHSNLESQLYQDAASTNFEELCITIDKLAKGLVLQPQERKLLANHAFIMRDDPNKALQKLNKAKNAIDKILHLV
ncbi:hypothetical protein NEF87_002455 [Candidatus Lokiarchaeum ossiferum]|uniref:Uncharacterized protein n=1 Tax=Candidatus Lokiarchaeum ossiferum TaxID=2951803 RepID=A0ABY6HRN4_9ARCH|nr:hypothetical protein NEF87_002455 [Candidatus Lokiarchaeum sp. B-35]